jgi:hypothetical protein
LGAALFCRKLSGWLMKLNIHCAVCNLEAELWKVGKHPSGDRWYKVQCHGTTASGDVPKAFADFANELGESLTITVFKATENVECK